MAQQNNTSFLLDDALYCSEEHWEDHELQKDHFQEEEEEEPLYFTNINHKLKTPPFILLEQDLFCEDEELISLLSKEKPNELYKILQADPSLAFARREAMEWMLKVNAHYSFSALTAILAVDYLDRFLSSFQFQREKPWMTQLTAVACISLASKIEDTQVPLLLDFQVEESKYVFEAKTIKRMEILVLSTLQWRLHPVTPLSFLDYITRRLGLKTHLCCELLRRCEKTLLSFILDSRFMSFLPSVLATATMLHVIDCIEPCLGVEYQKQLLGILGIDKDKVDDCYRLILEASRGKQCNNKQRKFGCDPGSPNGVVDISFSSDSSNDSWAVTSSVSSSPEHLSKRRRAEEKVLQTLDLTKAAEFLSIPR